MRKILALLIVALATLSNNMSIQAADLSSPDELKKDFSSYPAEMHHGEIAPLQWNDANSPEWVFPQMADQILRVLERDGLTAELNQVFGGHYIIQTVGCGTYCQTGVVVDLHTGMLVSQLPAAWYGYSWRPDSNLLILNPQDDEAPTNIARPKSAEYYVWEEGHGFQLIHEEEWITEWKGVATSSSGALYFSTMSSAEEVRTEIADSCFYSVDNCFQGVIVPTADWVMYLVECDDIVFTAAKNNRTGEIVGDSKGAEVSAEVQSKCSAKELF